MQLNYLTTIVATVFLLVCLVMNRGESWLLYHKIKRRRHRNRAQRHHNPMRNRLGQRAYYSETKIP